MSEDYVRTQAFASSGKVFLTYDVDVKGFEAVRRDGVKKDFLDGVVTVGDGWS